MGLLKNTLEVIKPYMKGAEVLSLGYPDIMMSDEDLYDVLEEECTERNEVTGLTETYLVFEAMGARLHTLDSVRQRGFEEVIDLDYPQVLGKYDFVLDAGTVEHCFNIGQAILNAANAVKLGGHIFHSSPISMVNHGFYNLNPTLYYDFYGQNGWKIKMMRITNSAGVVLRGEINPVKRVTCPPEVVMQVMAQRTNERLLKIPRQSKYL